MAETRILLIDDDEDDQFMFKDLLSQIAGQTFDITSALSYDAGLAALRTQSHDICFLDYRLGVRTGLELLKAAMAEGCRVPIVLLTGYGEHEVDLEAMRVGAADYLVKDQISPPIIERCIRYAMHRRQMEAQIIMQDRLASVGLLASSLAHEIGTPLGVIRGRAEYLGMQAGGDPAIQKNVDVIVSQIDRVSKLIRSLLNLARGDRAKVAGKILLNQTVAEVMDLMAHELRKHGIELRNRIGAEVQIAVAADAEQFHQVLLNLVVNSVHAIETASQKGRKDGHFVEISAREQGDKWLLSVKDSGCGISPQNLRNLFKPFFTTKEIGVGTGLGLATSYRLVEAWGGTIQAESTEGVGTEFRIAVPKG
jgi:signal transduction histidine kinase